MLNVCSIQLFKKKDPNEPEEEPPIEEEAEEFVEESIHTVYEPTPPSEQTEEDYPDFALPINAVLRREVIKQFREEKRRNKLLKVDLDNSYIDVDPKL